MLNLPSRSSKRAAAIPLYDYQESMVELAINTIADQSRLLVCSPVGSGKGHMIAETLVRAAYAGKRSALLVHRQEIYRDLKARIARLIQTQRGAGFTRDVHGRQVLPNMDELSSLKDAVGAPHERIKLISTQTGISRNVDLSNFDLLLADEAHHYASPEWRKLLMEYRKAVVGFTATAERGDRLSLKPVFWRMVTAVTYEELRSKYARLVPCGVYRPEAQITQGIAQDPITSYIECTPGHKAFCFTSSVERGKELAANFSAAGYPSACVHGETLPGERVRLVKDFEAGRITVLVNVYTMTEGVDVPSASVAILDRGCGNPSLYVQMCGRVLRAAAGKKVATIIDLTGVSHAFGMPDDERVWNWDSGVLTLNPSDSEGPNGSANSDHSVDVLDLPLSFVGPRVSQGLNGLTNETAEQPNAVVTDEYLGATTKEEYKKLLGVMVHNREISAMRTVALMKKCTLPSKRGKYQKRVDHLP